MKDDISTKQEVEMSTDDYIPAPVRKIFYGSSPDQIFNEQGARQSKKICEDELGVFVWAGRKIRK